MRDVKWISTILVLAATWSGCQGQRATPARAKPRVAVSIIPQQWLVEQIGGGQFEVLAVVGPGESHETFQPNDAQVSRLMSVDALFCVGVPFERSRAFSSLLAQGRFRMVDTGEGIPLREMTALERCDEASHGNHEREGREDEADSHGHAHEGKDPHIWLSPRLLKIQARAVARTLGELDPARKEVYDRNLAATEERLEAADREIRRVLEPCRGKMFFVFHPAWGYFADDYGLKQVAIEAEGKEPSDQEATALQKLARQQGVKVVFVQPQIAGRGAEAIAQAVGARVGLLDPLAPDLPDNLVRVARAIADSYR